MIVDRGSEGGGGRGECVQFLSSLQVLEDAVRGSDVGALRECPNARVLGRFPARIRRIRSPHSLVERAFGCLQVLLLVPTDFVLHHLQ